VSKRTPDPKLRFASALGRGHEIFESLEAPNWAPWLRFSAEQLDFQAELFEPGQLFVCDSDDEPVGLLSTTRIHWDGGVASLPTWDHLAADSTCFAARYAPEGNALVLLSASVRRDLRGSGIGTMLIDRSKDVAILHGIGSIVGPFRPSGFGPHKIRHPDCSFERYCTLRRDDGAPVDGWLRALDRARCEVLRIEPKAMVVQTTADCFRVFRSSYHPGSWHRVDDGRVFDLRIGEHCPREQLPRIQAAWECCETGTWYVDDDSDAAVYIESNVWGRVPLR
jgi:GNAT superfamily N-acetyltransferase